MDGRTEVTELSRRDGRGWICFSAQDWWYHNQAHSDFQLMRALARTAPVLVVNSIGMRMPLPGRSSMPLRRIARKAASIARTVRQPVPDLPGFHVMTPLIVPLYRSAAARTIDAVLVRSQVLRVARSLGITEPDIVVTIPTAAPVVRDMAHRTIVLNRSDKYSAFGEADGAAIAALERELLERADRVLYVSERLMAEESGLAGTRAHFLDHGVDVEHFTRRSPHDEPSDLAAIPHPRIGFFGGIDDYVVDLHLLDELAAAMPDAHLVLIGDATCPLGTLAERPNVHHLGFRPYADIPRYGSGFDVAIMPWLQNEWIEHCNPIKLKEYLALDLPVVTTPFPGVERWGDLVHVALGSGAFIDAVARALSQSRPPGAARAAVEHDTWQAKAAELNTLVETLVR